MPAPATPSSPRAGERIAKLLARAGVASRREVERMIAERRVALNGAIVETPATVLPGLKGVTVDGKPVAAPERPRLFAFHKPPGLLTAERDPKGRPTIYTALRNALPPGAPRLMPVGRLDFDTEGLLLLTNDGELKRAMELPASALPRTYRARTFGAISQARLEKLIEGITIDGMNYGRIDANLERRTGRNQWIELTLTEGKNREVRRVLEHLGLQVGRLIRVGYGPFNLGDLPRGAAVELPQKDVERLRKSLQSSPEREVAAAQRLTEGSKGPRTAPTIRARPLYHDGCAVAVPLPVPGGFVRVIAGEWRGRKLRAPEGDATRPTADRTRETLFSMLASRLGGFDGLNVADLFAGSGALGLEALSRGAARCLFVEQEAAALRALRANIAALRALRANIAALRAHDRSEVRAGSAFALGPAQAPLDLVLLDPPYGSGAGAVALDKLARLGWLSPASWASLETTADEAVAVKGFVIDAERRVGRAKLTLLRPASP